MAALEADSQEPGSIPTSSSNMLAQACDRSRTNLRKIGLTALVLVMSASLLLLEAGLRLLGPFQRAGKTPDHILWQPDKAIGFVPAANLDADLYTNEWLTHVYTNEWGFRVADKPSEVSKLSGNSILFLGDSQTMAAQVSVEATYIRQIQGELKYRGKSIEVINAGCNGFNTVQEYFFFQKLYDQGLRPKIVVLYVTNNDLFQDVSGLPYGRYELDSLGHLIPKPPQSEALNRLREAKQAPAHQANALLQHSALLRHLWYSYRILRSPHDVSVWTKNTYLRDDLDPLAQERWRVATAAIRSLNGLVSSYGGMLVVTVHPDPVEWSDAYYKRVVDNIPELSGQLDRMKIQHGYRRIAEDVGVRFIDMLSEFPDVSVREFRFALDPHANRSGHRIIAAQLLKGFQRLGLLD